MKALLLITISFSISASAQDSLSVRLKQVENRVNEIQLNLQLAHKQHRVGTALLGLGTLSTLIIVYNRTPSDSNIPLFISSIISAAGWVIILDSHRKIGYAGGIRYDY